MNIHLGKALLILALALLFSGCNEDEPVPPPVKPPVKEQPVARVPVPPAKPAVNPVEANWTETGYQGLDGKQWSTCWIAAAENPESVVDIVAGHVKKDWPAENELKTNPQSAMYKIPGHKNEFGEIRFASIAVNVSPDEGVRIEFKANSRADDLAEVGKVLRAEAELLFRLTSGGGGNAGDNNGGAAAGTPGPSVNQRQRHTISDFRQHPKLTDGKIDYGFPDEALKDIIIPFVQCRYGNRLVGSFSPWLDDEGLVTTPAYVDKDGVKKNAEGSLYVQKGGTVLGQDGFLRRPDGSLYPVGFKYNAKLTPGGAQQLFVMDNENRKMTGVVIETERNFAFVRDPTTLKNATKPCRLYRTFSFPESLFMDDNSVAMKNEETENIIVLIHGWNPDEEVNPYASSDWSELAHNLNTAVVGLKSKWSVQKYNWAADAATGPRLKDEGGVAGVKNGCQAAAIGHLHGHHLGELLDAQAPRLRKVHFIAHSAGAWVARSAVEYVFANMQDVQVQVTLLDPFMPVESGYSRTVLGANMINHLAVDPSENTRPITKLFRLENYFVFDEALGTQERFTWRDAVDVNLNVADYQKTKALFQPSVAMLAGEAIGISEHSAPIRFYAASVAGQVENSNMAQKGWRLSMAAQPQGNDQSANR